MMDNLTSLTGKSLLSFLSQIDTRLAVLLESFDFTANLSNHLLLKKLQKVFRDQGEDIASRMPLAMKFEPDSDQYHKAITNLLYLIDAINDEDKLDMFANIMRAFLNGMIDRDLFFRLADLLQKMYIGDIREFKMYIQKQKSSNDLTNIYVFQYLNLLVCTNENTYAALEGDKQYEPTQIGIELVRCAVDYAHYNDYVGASGKRQSRHGSIRLLGQAQLRE